MLFCSLKTSEKQPDYVQPTLVCLDQYPDSATLFADAAIGLCRPRFS